MDNIEFWKILRVLTTNYCNYKCTFCHNEGQKKSNNLKEILRFEDFKFILDSLSGTSLKEIHFSGGEPLLNDKTIDMIRYTDEHTKYEIGCATNATMINNGIIKELAETRVKLNIQFPAFTENEFRYITKSGSIYNTLKKLDLLREFKVEFGLNHVIIFEDPKQIESLIDFIRKHNYSLKLLPDLNDTNNSKLHNYLIPYLDSISKSKLDKQTGAIKWIIESYSQSDISVIYINSPCFYGDLFSCKNYAEIRLLPDLTLQPCIKKNSNQNLMNEVIQRNQYLVRQKFYETWNNFTSC